MRSGLIFIFAALAATTASAQRIELDGGNATTITIGPIETEIDRSVEGNLTVDLDDDGLSVDAGGSAEIGVNGESRSMGGTLAIGQADDEPTEAENPSSAEPAQDPSASPQSETPTSPPADAEDCSEPAAFAEQREEFLEQEPLDDFVYIRRIDISVCGYESSMPLIARLNSLPAIRAGLDHMQIDPDSIVSARWTEDRGLLVYTAEPEEEPEEEEAE